MAHLQIADARVYAELAVFDKDGTLIDFHRVWGGRAQRAVAALGDGVDAALHDALLHTMGVDRTTGRVDGQGLLAQFPHDVIHAHCLQTMIEAGVPPQRADRELRTRFAGVMRAPPQRGEMLAIGDLQALFSGLRAAGLRLGVVTTDDRDATLQTLSVLQLSEHVAQVVCGNDPVAAKPSPEGILRIAAALEVLPQHALMIGDTAADMRAGRAAGCFCVGVTSGACAAAQLRELADVVVNSVHEIHLLGTV